MAVRLTGRTEQDQEESKTG